MQHDKVWTVNQFWENVTCIQKTGILLLDGFGKCEIGASLQEEYENKFFIIFFILNVILVCF